VAKYNLNIKFLDGEIVDDPGLSYRSADTPIHRLATDVIDKLSKHDDFQRVDFLRKEADVSFFGLDTTPTDDVDIDIIFFDNPEIFDWYNIENSSQDVPAGLFCIGAGVFEETDRSPISAKLRVLVNVSEELITKHISAERKKELDPSSSKHDHEYIDAYMTTIGHELAHAIEFVEFSHSKSPMDAELTFQFNSDGEFLGEEFFTLTDIVTGNGIYNNFADDNKPLIQAMEDRVEARGKKWISEIEIDKSIMADCLSRYSPSARPPNGHGRMPL